jgi:hypothetical protein
MSADRQSPDLDSDDANFTESQSDTAVELEQTDVPLWQQCIDTTAALAKKRQQASGSAAQDEANALATRECSALAMAERERDQNVKPIAQNLSALLRNAGSRVGDRLYSRNFYILASAQAAAGTDATSSIASVADAEAEADADADAEADAEADADADIEADGDSTPGASASVHDLSTAVLAVDFLPIKCHLTVTLSADDEADSLATKWLARYAEFCGPRDADHPDPGSSKWCDDVTSALKSVLETTPGWASLPLRYEPKSEPTREEKMQATVLTLIAGNFTGAAPEAPKMVVEPLPSCASAQ